MTARRRRPRRAARRPRVAAPALPATPAGASDRSAPGASGHAGVTWKRVVAVEPAAVARADFLAGRGLPDDDAATGADPLLAIAAGAWRAMTDHARSAPVEVGGLLVGEVFRDEAGRLLVDAAVAIPALGALQEAAYFRLTEAAWEHISRQRAALHPDLLTVGWYHTHPGMGVFFSGTDRASQRAFFNRPWNVGLVIDPERDEIALFRGADSERLPPAHLVVYGDAKAREVALHGRSDGCPAGERRGDPALGVDRWAAGADDAGHAAGASEDIVGGYAANVRGVGRPVRVGLDGGERPFEPDAVRAQPRWGCVPVARGCIPGRAAGAHVSSIAADAVAPASPLVSEPAAARRAAPPGIPWAPLAAVAGAAMSMAFAVRAGMRLLRRRR